MIHSISAIDYDQDVLNEFGLVILDEVHHLGSRMFSKTLLKTSAEYTIGLSATPDRADEKHNIYFTFFDKIIDVKVHEHYETQFRFIGIRNGFECEGPNDMKEYLKRQKQRAIDNGYFYNTSDKIFNEISKLLS